MRRVFVILLSVLTLGGSLVLAPATTVEAESASASISKLVFTPGRPALGDPVSVTGRLSTHVARPVRLQRRDGNRWTTVATGTSANNGRFRLTAVAGARAVVFRVVAARVRLGKKTWPSVASAGHPVRTADLAPTNPAPGERFTLADKLPKKAVRSVVLQWLDGTTWRTMATTTSAKSGAFSLTGSTALALVTVRPFAPKARIGDKRWPAWAGPTTMIRTRAVITTAWLPDATRGAAYSQPLTATAGSPPYSWSAVGLPDGITLDPGTGVLSGTPVAAGTSAVTVILRDRAGTISRATLTLKVVLPEPLVVTTSALDLAPAGQPYHLTLKVRGGVPPYRWAATGLPAGITLTAGTGTLTGSTYSLGDHPVAFTVTDGTGTAATASLSLPVRAGRAVQVVAGGFHTCAVTEAGIPWCWGANSFGQLGDGTTDQHAVPARVLGLSDVTTLAAGRYHTCAVSDGDVYCWGATSDGRDDGASPRAVLSPTRVAGVSDAVALAAGDFHACALTSVHTVYCWGTNNLGQLGNGDWTGSAAPVLVSGLDDVTAIVAGAYHTCALRSTGGISCWGDNTVAQLDSGGWANTNLPIAAVGFGSTSARAHATQISAGGRTSCALVEDGVPRCWGANEVGQTGVGYATIWQLVPAEPQYLNPVLSISTGSFHTCVRSTDGLRCWGRNDRGQLGDGTTNDRVAPSMLPGPIGFSAVVTGLTHTCGITFAQGLNCWGDNQDGQLGNGAWGIGSNATPQVVVGFSD